MGTWVSLLAADAEQSRDVEVDAVGVVESIYVDADADDWAAFSVVGWIERVLGSEGSKARSCCVMGVDKDAEDRDGVADEVEKIWEYEGEPEVWAFWLSEEECCRALGCVTSPALYLA